MSSAPGAVDSVASLLLDAAAKAPEVTALATPDERITYSQLLIRAGAVARLCSRTGVGPGERVAIWLANGVDWMVAHWGATLAGCVVVPLATRHPAAEVSRLLTHSKATALFAGDRFGRIDAHERLLEVLDSASAGLKLTVVRSAESHAAPSGALVWEEALALPPNGSLPETMDRVAEVAADEIHLIQYTSGTTGEPKGAMLAHAGLVAAARAHAKAWGLVEADPIFVPNPFSHILGLMYGCLVPAASAASSLTMPVFDVEAALALLSSERAVALTGAPTHLQMLVDRPDREQLDLGSLRLAMTGGAPISERWARRVVEGLGLEALVNGYGMSEAGSVAQTAPGDPIEVVAGSVGEPMDGLEVRVVDPVSLEPLAAGETGELWIRGASVMRGYLDAPDLTRAALTPDGWLRTGDLVRRDGAGRLNYVNRRLEMFTVGGFNVYPARIEAVIREHPDVRQAVVLPLADDRLGARAQAVVTLASGGVAPADLAALCGDRLADYESPCRFVVVDEMPLNPAGKIDRRGVQGKLPGIEAAAAASVPGSDSGVVGEAGADAAVGCAPPIAEFGSYFVAAYPPFSQWTEDLQPEHLSALDRPPEAGSAPPGLYCHIPFCVERCRYCYYLSHSGRQIDRIDAYLEGVTSELELLARRPAFAGRPLDFVYFGGGTPSLLSTARLERLLPALDRIWSWSAAREVTFECAPRSVTAEKTAALRAAGVTRLSLGVQQLDDEILRRNGRVHLVADVEKAWESIRRADFPVVNMDLMVGLMGETEEGFFRSLERAVSMAPESITLYQMEIPLNTPLWEELQAGEEDRDPATWEAKHDRLERAFARLEELGYRSISAYTAVRDPARHGFVYQRAQYRGADMLGIGVSSFSYLQGVHHQNETSLGAFLAALGQGNLPLGRAYRLDADERAVREMVLQLKLGRVERAAFRRRHDVDPLERFAEPLKRLRDLGWLTIDRSAIELTARGVPRADRMLQEFYLPPHREVRYS